MLQFVPHVHFNNRPQIVGHDVPLVTAPELEADILLEVVALRGLLLAGGVRVQARAEERGAMAIPNAVRANVVLSHHLDCLDHGAQEGMRSQAFICRHFGCHEKIGRPGPINIHYGMTTPWVLEVRQKNVVSNLPSIEWNPASSSLSRRT